MYMIRILSECQNTTEMLQAKISHMFDNSPYSKCSIHRKLQQALAQVLGNLGSAKRVIAVFPNRQRTNKKSFYLQKIPPI